jgi:hypothetical protein
MAKQIDEKLLKQERQKLIKKYTNTKTSLDLAKCSVHNCATQSVELFKVGLETLNMNCTLEKSDCSEIKEAEQLLKQTPLPVQQIYDKMVLLSMKYLS